MKSFSNTDVGKVRKINQDYVYKADDTIGALGNLYIVADGMGGHQSGDYASKFTVEHVREEILTLDGINPARLLEDSIIKANNLLYKESKTRPELADMGTTVIAASVKDNILYFANVGDSRLYLINHGIKQLSIDHSFVEELVRLGGLKSEDARNHPEKNKITRAIGTQGDVEVDTFEHRLTEGDIILMCTDGLTNMVADDEIFEIIQGSRDLVEAVSKLINTANEYGGNDNIGVILFEPIVGEVDIC